MVPTISLSPGVGFSRPLQPLALFPAVIQQTQGMGSPARYRAPSLPVLGSRLYSGVFSPRFNRTSHRARFHLGGHYRRAHGHSAGRLTQGSFKASQLKLSVLASAVATQSPRAAESRAVSSKRPARRFSRLNGSGTVPPDGLEPVLQHYIQMVRNQKDAEGILNQPTADPRSVIEKYVRVKLSNLRQDLRNVLVLSRDNRTSIRSKALNFAARQMKALELKIDRVWGGNLSSDERKLKHDLKNKLTHVSTWVGMFKRSIAKGEDLQREQIDKLLPVIESLGRMIASYLPNVVLETDSPNLAGYALKSPQDRERFERILANMGTNLTRYGRGNIVRAKLSERQGMLILEVRDQGIGMSPEELAQYGELDFRAPDATRLVPEGTGTGIRSMLEEAAALGYYYHLVHTKKGEGTTSIFAFSINRFETHGEFEQPLAIEPLSINRIRQVSGFDHIGGSGSARLFIGGGDYPIFTTLEYTQLTPAASSSAATPPLHPPPGSPENDSRQ